MKDIIVLKGAVSIGQVIAKRVGAGKHEMLVDLGQAEHIHEVSEDDPTNPETSRRLTTDTSAPKSAPGPKSRP